MGEETHARAFGVMVSPRRRAWSRCLHLTRLEVVLFFVDCSVPLTRGRVGWLHRAPLPPEASER